MKLSPQEHVKKMVSLDQSDSPDSQEILNTKPSASRQKSLQKRICMVWDIMNEGCKTKQYLL